MGDFAFRIGPDSSGAWTRKAASRARDSLKAEGHKAVVERGGDGSRVRVQHPTDKNLVAYYNDDDHAQTQGDMSKFKPYYVKK